MIIVTGGCGFIGSNIIKGLNDVGNEELLIFDDITAGNKKMKNKKVLGVNILP